MKNKLIIAIPVLAAVIGAWILLPDSVFAYKETATSYQDGYDKGYNDAIGGFSYYVDQDHTEIYKNGYQNGYRDGIASTHNNNNGDNGNDNNNNNGIVPARTFSDEKQAQTLGPVNIKGSHNRVTVNQIQGQSTDQNSHNGNSYSKSFNLEDTLIPPSD